MSNELVRICKQQIAKKKVEHSKKQFKMSNGRPVIVEVHVRERIEEEQPEERTITFDDILFYKYGGKDKLNMDGQLSVYYDFLNPLLIQGKIWFLFEPDESKDLSKQDIAQYLIRRGYVDDFEVALYFIDEIVRAPYSYTRFWFNIYLKPDGTEFYVLRREVLSD